MGGQACVLYGGAEFSKDFDFVILVDPENLTNLKILLDSLEAEIIAVPPFDPEFLLKGHALHFRAKAKGFENLRIDLMAKLRGVDPFEQLWSRRTTVELLPSLQVEVLSLRDLVDAKKTRRDKDWPMIKRLVDVDYLNFKESPSESQLLFWLKELRTYQFLEEIASRHRDLVVSKRSIRPMILGSILDQDETAFRSALKDEEDKIREQDELYWRPLVQELETLRHQLRRK